MEAEAVAAVDLSVGEHADDTPKPLGFSRPMAYPIVLPTIRIPDQIRADGGGLLGPEKLLDRVPPGIIMYLRRINVHAAVPETVVAGALTLYHDADDPRNVIDYALQLPNASSWDRGEVAIGSNADSLVVKGSGFPANNKVFFVMEFELILARDVASASDLLGFAQDHSERPRVPVARHAVR